MIVPKAVLHQPRETNPQLVSMDIIYELTNHLTDLAEENMVWATETMSFGLAFVC